jgi:CDP-diacylglycerol--glycerol-3-phosphate 3-phosphatidyltransferase
MHCSANLNNDYFKNRQDRYYWFNNSNNLSSYFANLISTINSISYKVTPRSPKDYYLKITDEKVPDPVNKSEEFKKIAKFKLNNFLHMTTSESASQLDKLNDESVDTVVFPTLQMKPLGIDLDSRVTKGLMSHLNQAGRMVGKGKSAYTNVISTSYFNLDPMYLDSILNTSGQFNVLTSAPEVLDLSLY